MVRIMDYIAVKNLKVAYKEINSGADQSIFFIHGNSGSSRSWDKQLNEPLLSKYRLVAFDLPGHGESSHSDNAEEDYSPVGTAETVAAAIGQLHQNKPYILVGFSYGTNVIAEALRFGISPSGMVMIGMCCIGENYGFDKVFVPVEGQSIFTYNENDRVVVSETVNGLLENQRESFDVINDYLKTDKNFKPFLYKGVADGKITEEVNSVKSAGIPVSVIYGAKDKIVNPDHLLDSGINFWRDNIIVLDKCDHFAHLDRYDEVNRMIKTFAEEVFRS